MFLIPNPLQVILDDLGWFCGTDDRKNGGASRTGIDRRHCAEDYAAVNALGEALGMKINCALIMGEWDPDNRLRAIPHLSKYGENWDNAKFYNAAEAIRCAEVINASPYIDIAIHGLNHGYYLEGVDNVDLSDYYYQISDKLIAVSEDEVRARLDAFFDLLRHHGITKKINSMVPPSWLYRWHELSHILKDYGVKYITSLFSANADCDDPIAAVEKSGVIIANRCNNFVDWKELDSPTDALPIDGIGKYSDGAPTFGVFGLHWPNLLHPDPSRNMEVVNRWVAYFKRCAEQFTTVLSPDVAFACHQLLYLRHTKTELSKNKIMLDLSDVPITADFCVNIKGMLKSAQGCKVSEYARHVDFITYKLTPTEQKITILI